MTTWSVTEALHESRTVRSLEHINVIKVSLTAGNDTSVSDYDLGSASAPVDKDYWQGSTLYMMKVVPGTAGATPSGTFDIDIEDENDDHLLDTDANANDSNTLIAGSDTLGLFPPVTRTCSVVCADIGDENSVDVYLYFWK